MACSFKNNNNFFLKKKSGKLWFTGAFYSTCRLGVSTILESEKGNLPVSSQMGGFFLALSPGPVPDL